MAKIMHRLILMRHAQAESSAPSGGDEARPLSAAGRAEALLMGRALAERGLKPDLALVSTAVRTRQTWEQMHDAFGDVAYGGPRRPPPPLSHLFPSIAFTAPHSPRRRRDRLLLR